MTAVKRFPTPRVLDELARHFDRAGFRCFLVGGALRNIALRGKPTDYDLATDAHPGDVQRIFRRVIPTGIQHGTVTVLYKGHQFEVTTFRTESTYSDSRRPDSVAFSTSIEEDLSRRDFTINGMALDLVNREFHDPYGGLEDIDSKTVRAIGEPAERFSEDGLRVMRAIRFATQLEFSLDAATREAIPRALPALQRVSAERKRDELVKTIQAAHPARGILLMQETGVMSQLIPELAACDSVAQGEGVNRTVLTHSAYACEGAPADRLEIRLAALLHDVGKVDTYEEDEEVGMRFHGHDAVSADYARAILTRLRFSNDVTSTVAHLVRHHMFDYDPTGWTDATVRRFISRVGAQYVDDLILLRRADSYGKAGHPVRDRRLEALEEHVREVLAADSALSVRDLAVNGNTLHEEAGIPKGPLMGRTLEFLLESVLQDPAQNTREKLLEIARNYYEQRLQTGR
ncbi:MAG: HD domain-containing protein [Spirochaetes bacterium]|jgi:poly(A) polymerase/tRNA nucleotidyltransferase (CCA-adding enzyme)|nr:HD domain-containing protein [Spirochaetota bacterium]